MENFNESTVTEIEKFVHEFYELAKTSPIEHEEKLKQFNNIDLEDHLHENGNLEIDIKALLELDN